MAGVDGKNNRTLSPITARNRTTLPLQHQFHADYQYRRRTAGSQPQRTNTAIVQKSRMIFCKFCQAAAS